MWKHSHVQSLRAIANIGFGDESLYFESLKSLWKCVYVGLCVQNTQLGVLLTMSILYHCDLTGINRGIPDLCRQEK